MAKVTREQFKRYVEVQSVGSYNMMGRNARDAAGLTREVHFEIIQNYDKFASQWPDVIEEVLEG